MRFEVPTSGVGCLAVTQRSPCSAAIARDSQRRQTATSLQYVPTRRLYRKCVRPEVNKSWLLARYASSCSAAGTLPFGPPMEHRGVRYEIKVGIAKSHWVWIVHISPTPRQGSVEGTRQDAIIAAQRAINDWWRRRYGRHATRVESQPKTPLCRRCGALMQLARELPQLGPSPAIRVFVCADCGEVEMNEPRRRQAT
jgi:hypothetical protein